MTIQDIYDLGIKLGTASDLRPKESVTKVLDDAKKAFNKLDAKDKEYFDKERFTNPYSDTRILAGDPKKTVKKVLTGIDMEAPEMILAHMLGDIDLVISHHPRGVALAGLDDVMKLQAEVLNQYGVPIHFAEKLLKIRISEVTRGLHSTNHERAPDTAKLLGVPFLCMHTPVDNLVANFLKGKVEAAPLDTVGDLMEIPEYQAAKKLGVGPTLFSGAEENQAGKIAVTEITGGVEGSPKLYEKLSQAGISTIVGMHVSEKHREAAEEVHLNFVIAGHMSSDSIGMNLFLDEIEKKGVEIVPASGLIRVQRTSKKK